MAIAVIAHDFADGLNTVTLMLVNKNSSRRALTMLLLDAIAPIFGVLSTVAVSIPNVALPYYLGFFAGFLLYIGASDILPEAHGRGRRHDDRPDDSRHALRIRSRQVRLIMTRVSGNRGSLTRSDGT